MQTASGEALQDGSNHSRRSGSRRRGTSPLVWIIAALLLILALIVMGVYLLGIWPPKSAESSMTVAEQWSQSRTATPGIQHANGLLVEKVGTPRHEGDTVTVTLKVTNHVMMPDPKVPTPEPGKPAPSPVPAIVYNGNIRVLFFIQEGEEQKIVGGGYGNVVNLKPGESQTIVVVSTPVEDYSDATQYEAFPDYVWTDKDPIKATPEGETGSGGSPVPGKPTP